MPTNRDSSSTLNETGASLATRLARLWRGSARAVAPPLRVGVAAYTSLPPSSTACLLSACGRRQQAQVAEEVIAPYRYVILTQLRHHIRVTLPPLKQRHAQRAI